MSANKHRRGRKAPGVAQSGLWGGETVVKVRPLAEEDRWVKWRRHLWNSYHITPAQYDAMYEAQGGVCAICGKPETAVGGRLGNTPLRLAVDHDHATGQVRGLLCSSCNQGIGMLRHDGVILRRALVYLIGYDRAS